MTSKVKEYFIENLNYYLKKIIKLNKSQGFYKLVLMFNWVYKLLHLNQCGWRKKLLFKSYRALNSAMHDFSEVSNSLSLPRQVKRDCRWPAEPEETEIIYGLSNSSFCRSQWLSKVLRLPKIGGSGSAMSICCRVQEEKYCCEGLPEKAGKHQIACFLAFWLCVVMPMLITILSQNHIF